jgi:hypothetical protein
LRVIPVLLAGSILDMAKRKKRRQRIDTMIDAHVAMRREARAKGETCAEVWLREAFRHPGKVTLTEYHEDGSETKRVLSDRR